jgi:hypothetical protein
MAFCTDCSGGYNPTLPVSPYDGGGCSSCSAITRVDVLPSTGYANPGTIYLTGDNQLYVLNTDKNGFINISGGTSGTVVSLISEDGTEDLNTVDITEAQ